MRYEDFKQLNDIMIKHNGSVRVGKSDASDYLELLESKSLMYISARHSVNDETLHLTYTVDMPKYRRARKVWLA